MLLFLIFDICAYIVVFMDLFYCFNFGYLSLRKGNEKGVVLSVYREEKDDIDYY